MLLMAANLALGPPELPTEAGFLFTHMILTANGDIEAASEAERWAVTRDLGPSEEALLAILELALASYGGDIARGQLAVDAFRGNVYEMLRLALRFHGYTTR
jgi:hypothetical protein